MNYQFFNNIASYLRQELAIDQNFDIVERNIKIGGRNSYLYFIDGFVNSSLMERILAAFFAVSPSEMESYQSAEAFVQNVLPNTQGEMEFNRQKMIKSILSGQTVLLIEGYTEAIVMEVRSYPARGVEEPEKEKSLRGPKDGLVEPLMPNLAMIRRRIRDPRLTFELFTVGEVSQTDLCVGYMKGVADEQILAKIVKKIKGIKLDTLTVGDQSLVEAIGKSQWLNPYPKVRYTQRPDVISAHLTEGKIVVVIDNSPTAILIPTSIFDFLQNTDDYYFPLLTGNYFRLLRMINMIAVLFLTPTYLLLAEGYIPIHERLQFFLPDEGYALPLFVQFIILEIAIDALNLASLNTPNSLGMSLGVIGALILGQFSIDTGWFIPQTILCMAVLALAGFTQPSIELGYAIKFMRIFLLIGVGICGLYGVVIVLTINAIILVKTKNIVGECYLYPLYPFDWKILKRLLFRTRQSTAAD